MNKNIRKLIKLKKHACVCVSSFVFFSVLFVCTKNGVKSEIFKECGNKLDHREKLDEGFQLQKKTKKKKKQKIIHMYRNQ